MKTYYVKSGTKVDCIMGVAKGKTQISYIKYLVLTFLGFDTFIVVG